MIPVDKFMERVIPEPNCGCWLWMGSYAYRKESGPRGQFYINRKRQYASRVSYQIFKGQIPDDLVVRHKCDNGLCVNPDHLILGTQLDNIQDRVSRGRNGNAHGENNPKSRLTDSLVKRLREERSKGTGWGTIAKLFGISIYAVRYACQYGWKHI